MKPAFSPSIQRRLPAFCKISPLWLGCLALVLGGLLSLFDAPKAFSSGIKSPQQNRLRQLRIKQIKRDLRLSDNDKAPEAALKKRYDENQFEALLQEVDSLPAAAKTADVFLIYGNSLFFLGKTAQAVAAYEQAFRMASTPQEKAAAMANFGLMFSKRGRWEEAIRWLEKTLEIDRKTDNWRGQGIALSLLGNFYFQSGKTEEGAAAHIESLEIAETIPIPWLEARQLNVLGNLYYLDRIFHLAHDNYQKSSKIYHKLKDPLGEAAALSGLSFVLKDLEKFDEALTQQSKSLVLYRELGDLQNEIKGLINFSLIYRDQGNFKAALDSGEKALKLQEKTDDLQGMGGTEGMIGSIYQKKGDLQKAIHHLKKAREHFEKSGASQEIHIVDLSLQALQDEME